MGGCQSVRNKYIIGIDGGGTKTLGVLFDFDGNELHRVKEGFSNFSIDEKEATDNLSKTIEQLQNKIVDTDYELYIQLGISGASKIKETTTLERDFEKKFHAIVNLETDLMIGLYSVSQTLDQSVIMAIGGTGSAVVAKEGNRIKSIGGYGYLLGDEGSGYHLVIEALRRVIKESEEERPLSELSIGLMKLIGITSHRQLISYVYQKNKTELAQLSRFIAKQSIEGDLVAKALLENEGKLLAEQIVLAHNNFIKNNEVAIALRGTFVNEAPYVKDALKKHLDDHIKNYKIEETSNEPVIGAYHLAKAILVKG